MLPNVQSQDIIPVKSGVNLFKITRQEVHELNRILGDDILLHDDIPSFVISHQKSIDQKHTLPQIPIDPSKPLPFIKLFSPSIPHILAKEIHDKREHEWTLSWKRIGFERATPSLHLVAQQISNQRASQLSQSVPLSINLNDILVHVVPQSPFIVPTPPPLKQTHQTPHFRQASPKHTKQSIRHLFHRHNVNMFSIKPLLIHFLPPTGITLFSPPIISQSHHCGLATELQTCEARHRTSQPGPSLSNTFSVTSDHEDEEMTRHAVQTSPQSPALSPTPELHQFQKHSITHPPPTLSLRTLPLFWTPQILHSFHRPTFQSDFFTKLLHIHPLFAHPSPLLLSIRRQERRRFYSIGKQTHKKKGEFDTTRYKPRHPRLQHTSVDSLLDLSIDSEIRQNPNAFVSNISDFSGVDGRVVLFEFVEEHPLLLSSVGMMSSLVRIVPHPPRDLSPSEAEFCEFGDETHHSNFVHPILPHSVFPSQTFFLENNLFTAPAAPHALSRSDFLVVSSTVESNVLHFNIREIDAIFTVGQVQPHKVVPTPNSRALHVTSSNRLAVAVVNTLKEQQTTNPNTVPSISTISLRKQFTQPQLDLIRPHLNRFCIKTSVAFSPYSLKPTVLLPDDQAMQTSCSPESFVAVGHSLHTIARFDEIKATMIKALALLPSQLVLRSFSRTIRRFQRTVPWEQTAVFQNFVNSNSILETNTPSAPIGPKMSLAFERMRKDTIRRVKAEISEKTGERRGEELQQAVVGLQNYARSLIVRNQLSFIRSEWKHVPTITRRWKEYELSKELYEMIVKEDAIDEIIQNMQNRAKERSTRDQIVLSGMAMQLESAYEEVKEIERQNEILRKDTESQQLLLNIPNPYTTQQPILSLPAKREPAQHTLPTPQRANTPPETFGTFGESSVSLSENEGSDGDDWSFDESILQPVNLSDSVPLPTFPLRGHVVFSSNPSSNSPPSVPLSSAQCVVRVTVSTALPDGSTLVQVSFIDDPSVVQAMHSFCAIDAQMPTGRILDSKWANLGTEEEERLAQLTARRERVQSCLRSVRVRLNRRMRELEKQANEETRAELERVRQEELERAWNEEKIGRKKERVMSVSERAAMLKLNDLKLQQLQSDATRYEKQVSILKSREVAILNPSTTQSQLLLPDEPILSPPPINGRPVLYSDSEPDMNKITHSLIEEGKMRVTRMDDDIFGESFSPQKNRNQKAARRELFIQRMKKSRLELVPLPNRKKKKDRSRLTSPSKRRQTEFKFTLASGQAMPAKLPPKPETDTVLSLFQRRRGEWRKVWEETEKRKTVEQLELLSTLPIRNETPLTQLLTQIGKGTTEDEHSQPAAQPASDSDSNSSEIVELEVVKERARRKANPQVELSSLLDQLCSRLLNSPHCEYFQILPSRSVLPGFSNIVPVSIDVGRIRENVRKNRYSSRQAFLQDLYLLCYHVHAYSRSVEVHPTLTLSADLLVEMAEYEFFRKEEEYLRLENLIS
ncbi:putative Transcription initiation factor TFIID subunit 1 [Blattamonas nauphoetae]|uniref:Transcription initiation factor TFIID subunit 1 n=1 Tax=Blattamonas nauphoetae TaxID=2049346 RepID=A0ABQ9XCK5_9EUKA|nr:putative Transcription initiation factor TFIID subunit 1 [Blattamonas nauphoetae]